MKPIIWIRGMDGDDCSDGMPSLRGQLELFSMKPAFNGGYSSVYYGRIGQTHVAVKVLREIRGAEVHTMRRKLRRERTIWGGLRHPNVLPLYGFADDHELFQPFGAFISPWRAEGNVFQYLKAEGKNLSEIQRLNMWRGIVAGVEYLHNHTPVLIHGDLKSANVLIDDSGDPQVCDFGLVSIYLEEGNSGMTTTSPYTGTDRYLAYELVSNGETVIPTTASDIFALGCIGLECCFLRQPYAHRKHNMQGLIFMDIRAGRPPASRTIVSNSQEAAIWNLLEQCWSREPSQRPSARELLTSLQGYPFAAEHSIAPRDIPWLETPVHDGENQPGTPMQRVDSPSSMTSSLSTEETDEMHEIGTSNPTTTIGVHPDATNARHDGEADRKSHIRRLSDVLRESHFTNYEWRPTFFKINDVVLHRTTFWFQGMEYGSSPNLHLSAEDAREEAATYVLPSIIKALRVDRKAGRDPVAKG